MCLRQIVKAREGGDAFQPITTLAPVSQPWTGRAAAGPGRRGSIAPCFEGVPASRQSRPLPPNLTLFQTAASWRPSFLLVDTALVSLVRRANEGPQKDSNLQDRAEQRELVAVSQDRARCSPGARAWRLGRHDSAAIGARRRRRSSPVRLCAAAAALRVSIGLAAASALRPTIPLRRAARRKWPPPAPNITHGAAEHGQQAQQAGPRLEGPKG